MIRFRSGKQMVILGKEQLFLQSGCSLEELVAATPASTLVRKLSDSSEAVTLTRQKGRELSELQWMLAYEISAGRMLFDARDTDIFTLNRWPNFTRLPHSDNCLRMAALLGRRATSVALVAKMLKVPLSQVRQFYVAAREAGYTEALRSAEVIDLQPAIQQRSLISSLLMKLKRA
ncbi:hypothetical protein [Oceanobacter mangrovi]|uniref:hypothetical protein n=1 Tax=Oceanobacter mangrovi TaxID=2862510 RepID=UPI001C8EE8BA|nr:hypothetical protein [Oceanobacter mangrovi]